MDPLTHPSAADGSCDLALLRRVTSVLAEATDRDVSAYRPATLARAIARRMAARGASALTGYVALLADDRREAHALVDELSIGVTAFFRDEAVFDALEQRIVPALAEAARASGELRAWIPGCATGEEAYSVAALLLEAAAREGGFEPRVFATDVDEAALAAARAGRYALESCGRMGPQRLARFFEVQGTHAAVTRDLRDACVFASHDLARDPPFGRLDLVCCRNVLIYFDEEARRRALPILHHSLRPGGVLVLGLAEGVPHDDRLFEPVEARLRIFRRCGSNRAMPAVVQAPRRDARRDASAPARQPNEEVRVISDFEHILLREIAPACAVVDASGVVLHYSGPIARYLEPQGSPSSHIVDLAKDSLRLEVKTALRRAAEERRTVTEDAQVTGVDGYTEVTEIVVRPLGAAGAHEDGRYLVAFRDVRLARAPLPNGAVATTVEQQLRAELASVRQRLQATIDELRQSNAEHRRANEKLRTLNEELQASQEELQSLNEELQTVNSELATKVDELDRANGDLQNLFRSTDVAVLFLGADLTIKKFTPAATRLFPLIDADLGRRITDITARFPAGGLSEEIEDVVRTSAVRERQVEVAETARWYALRILPYATLGGGTNGAIVTFVDITEAKVAEAASRASEVRLRQLVDSVPHLVWTATADGTRDYFSQQWRDYTGLSAGPQLDLGWIEAYHPDDRTAMLAAWGVSVRTGEPFHAEYRIRRHDGVYRWFKGRATALRDASGRVERWIGTSTDIDDVKRLEASLREASLRKDAFMALLGHELRNPLAPLGNSLDILRRDRRDPQRVTRAVEVIDRQVTHLARLVDDLLDVSRITRGKVHLRRERLDLSAQVTALIEDHRALFAAAALRLETDIASEPVWIDGDPARVAQMIGNLLQNALKFTDRGGTVAVAVAVDGRSASVRVRDTGIGMDPASIEKMFDAFAQADSTLAHSRGGLGLGLALVKAFAELHGGSVNATSAGLGRGSEFAVRLPLAAGAPATSPREAARPPPRRVLVVDDNVDAVETLAELLRFEGHDVRVATDGRAAILEARRFRPDIAFCDIGLPGELDGYAVARALRADPAMAGTVLVAMTGYATEEDQRRSLDAGFSMHLAKPARIEVVERVLATAPGRRGPP